jgi:hypothetical protein
MQAKLNIVLKLANECGLAIVDDSQFKLVAALSEMDRLRLSTKDILDEYKVEEELCDDLIQKLNDIKKKTFEIKILDSGKSIGSAIELKELKSRGVEKLISVPSDTTNQVRAFETQILSEQVYLAEQRKKSKETLAEENNLLPNLNFRVGISLLLSFVAGIFVFLGYIASTDERFYDKDFGYWSMLIGGLGLLITLNIFVIRVVQAVRFQLNKKKAIDDLGYKYISKLETDFEALESRIRTRIFGLESVVYVVECKRKLVEAKLEFRDLKEKVSNHFK